MKIKNRLYEAKDLKRILGLKPETAYLWLRTYHFFEPAARAERRGKNKYSLIDLVRLAVIRELDSFGMRLDVIKGVFEELEKEKVWDELVNERKKMDTEGAVIIIDRGKYLNPTPDQNEFSSIVMSGTSAAEQIVDDLVYPDWAGGRVRYYTSTLIVNVRDIVEFVERETGEKLS